MSIIYCAFCIFVAFFSTPFALAAMNASHGLERIPIQYKIYHALVIFLVTTFPIVNIIAAIEFCFNQTTYMSYVVSFYGFTFLVFYLVDSKIEQKVR